MSSPTTQQKQKGLSPHLALLVLFFVCCLSLLMVSPILVLTDDQILDRHGSDDLFYFLQLAEHSAPFSAWLSGNQQPAISFDGIHPTNGVQPAWWVAVSGLSAVLGEHQQLRALLIMAVVFHLASGILLFVWLSSLQGIADRIALIAASLWILHPRPMSTTLEGTEAGLLAFVWVLCLWLWCTSSFTPSIRIDGRRGTLGLSLALALGVLTRVDFLLPAIALSLFAPSPNTLPTRRNLRQVAWIAGPWVVALSCWMSFSFWATDSAVPDSGAAKQLHRQMLEVSLDEVRNACDSDTSLSTVLSAQRFANPSTQIAGAKLIAQHLSQNGSSSILFVILCLAALVVFLTNRHSTAGLARTLARRAWPLAIGFALVAIYLCTLGFVRSWYLVPLALLQTLTAACLYAVFLSRWPALNRPPIAALLLLAWIAAAHIETAQAPARPYNGTIYRFSQSARKQIPPGARVGAFNAGIPSWVLGPQHTVVNLDGVVNQGARSALKAGTLADYMERKEIDFVLDLNTTIDFFAQYSCSPWTQDFHVVMRSPVLSPAGSTQLVLLERSDRAPTSHAEPRNVPLLR